MHRQVRLAEPVRGRPILVPIRVDERGAADLFKSADLFCTQLQFGRAEIVGVRLESEPGREELLRRCTGRSRDEVEAELFERYGDVLRPAPRAEGFGITAYVFPMLAFLAGGVIVVVFLLRQTRAAATPASLAQPPDPELERIIDQELAG